jgi:hypothetical protein
MNAETERAYRRWRMLADRGYGSRPIDTPGRMARVDARIREAKAKYERLLLAEKKGKTDANA